MRLVRPAPKPFGLAGREAALRLLVCGAPTAPRTLVRLRD